MGGRDSWECVAENNKSCLQDWYFWCVFSSSSAQMLNSKLDVFYSTKNIQTNFFCLFVCLLLNSSQSDVKMIRGENKWMVIQVGMRNCLLVCFLCVVIILNHTTTLREKVSLSIFICGVWTWTLSFYHYLSERGRGRVEVGGRLSHHTKEDFFQNSVWEWFCFCLIFDFLAFSSGRSPDRNVTRWQWLKHRIR